MHSLLMWSLLTASSWQVPWKDGSRPHRFEGTPWGDSDSQGSGYSLSRKERREDFFNSLIEDVPASSSLPAERPKISPFGGGAGVADEDAEGSRELSRLPWGRFEEEATLQDSGLQREAGFLWPVSGAKMGSPFGVRGSGFHEGVDISANHGAAIRAAASGEVVYSSWIEGYGRTIVIYHGDGLTTVYAHNSRNQVERGDHVKQGQVIGAVGQTGRASGPHLHFEVRKKGRPIDPFRFSFLRYPMVSSR